MTDLAVLSRRLRRTPVPASQGSPSRPSRWRRSRVRPTAARSPTRWSARQTYRRGCCTPSPWRNRAADTPSTAAAWPGPGRSGPVPRPTTCRPRRWPCARWRSFVRPAAATSTSAACRSISGTIRGPSPRSTTPSIRSPTSSTAHASSSSCSWKPARGRRRPAVTTPPTRIVARPIGPASTACGGTCAAARAGQAPMISEALFVDDQLIRLAGGPSATRLDPDPPLRIDQLIRLGGGPRGLVSISARCRRPTSSPALPAIRARPGSIPSRRRASSCTPTTGGSSGDQGLGGARPLAHPEQMDGFNVAREGT